MDKVTISFAAVAATAIAAGAIASRRRRRRHQQAPSTHDQAPLYKFVLTGGPCGGKTTALDRLAEFFRDNGFTVYTVPEAATLMFTNGVSFPDLADPDIKFAFQWSIISLQMELEDGFERVARASRRPSVLLCDRGLLDGAAYMPEEEWVRLLTAKGLDTVSLREGRYNGVFHLVTAADGAERFYNLANNETRTETPEFAREMDGNTQRVWLGHPHHFLFDNSTDFDRKIARIIAAASRIAGLPVLQRVDHKYLLLKWPHLGTFPVPFQEFQVEKIFLRSGAAGASNGAASDELTVGEEVYSFVRKRTQDGFSAYGLTTVRTVPANGGGSSGSGGSSGRDDDGRGSGGGNDSGGKGVGTVRRETKRIISAAEYEALAALFADPARHVVRQQRVSFLWRHQSFTMQHYQQPYGGADVLHCQTEGGGVELPTFLEVGPMVAHDNRFSAYAVSSKSWRPPEGALCIAPEAVEARAAEARPEPQPLQEKQVQRERQEQQPQQPQPLAALKTALPATPAAMPRQPPVSPLAPRRRMSAGSSNGGGGGGAAKRSDTRSSGEPSGL